MKYALFVCCSHAYRVTSWSNWLALIYDRVSVTVKVYIQNFDKVAGGLPFTPATLA